MKNAGIILLTLVFLVQTFRQPMVFLNYQINKEYIIAKLCENKDKPELKCHGKCHLKKKLDQSDTSDTRDKKSSDSIKTDLFFASEEEKKDIIQVSEGSRVTYPDDLSAVPSEPALRPPIA